MTRSISVLAVAGVAWMVSTAAGAAVENRGKIEAVTVYRGQALVTRVVDVAGPAGLREVVVTDLPASVIPGSIYAESADGVEVRSVRYRTRPLNEDVREEVRKLDEQIRTLQDEIEANTRHVALLTEHKAYLGKLEGFVAPTATVELTRGVLNAETLKLLSTFLLDQRQSAATEELERAVEGRRLQQQHELLNRQREQLTAGSARTAREAVVFLNLQAAENSQFRLRYLVGNANWTPSYNLRTDAAQKEVRVEYYSSIQQMSGEDWPDVAMTLSTATPSLVAKAPLLTELTLALSAAQPEAQQRAAAVDSKGYIAARDELNRKKIQFENIRNQSGAVQMQQAAEAQSQQAEVNADMGLNSIANEMQILDLVTRGTVVARSGKADRVVFDEGVSVTYQLAGRTSLPSRDDQQLIQIASLPMKADFYKLAIPVLTSYVYNEAAVTNTSPMVLLAGPVSAYVAGQFVGRGEIPTVAVGEDFTVGFGIDTSLRAAREMVERTESIQGGNRTVDFTYRLALENFGSAPAAVRVLDRLPTAKDNQVRIELTSTGEHKVSEDPRYLQTERKKGILRWEVQVPAQAIGPKALNVDYKLRLEYDKQMHLAGLPAVAAAR